MMGLLIVLDDFPTINGGPPVKGLDIERVMDNAVAAAGQPD